jgi:hypothetical protein
MSFHQLEPDADILDGGWTNEAAGTTLYPSIAGLTANDTTYIRSSDNPDGDIVRISIANPTETVVMPVSVSYRIRGVGFPYLTVRLKEGTTVIAEWLHEELTETFTTFTQNLTQGQFDSVTSWSDVYWEFQADATLDGTALNLDFLNMGTLDSRVTFSRASTATQFDSDGVLQTAATNAARFDHNPSTLAPRGLLLEEQRTNILKQSAKTNLDEWSPYIDGGNTSNRTANSAVSPDGTTTATLHTINRATTNWAQAGKQNFTGTAAVHTGSIWLKAFDASNVGRVIDLAIRGNAATTVLQVALPAEWTRYTVTETLFAGTCEFVFGYISGSDSNWTGEGLTTGETKFYAWGGQVELGSSATSYIPTTTASVTRAADDAIMTGTDFSSWYNATEGTFIVDVSIDSNNDNTRTLFFWDQVNDNESISLAGHAVTSDFDFVVIADGGVTQVNEEIGAHTKGVSYKVGLALKLNDVAYCKDGGTVLTDTTVTLPTLTELRFGQRQSDFRVPCILFERLTYYNTRKTDAEIQDLTGPSLELDFITQDLDPRITFTRASSATYFNRDGVLRISPSGAARFDYDPETLERRGLLLEEQRTNLALHSQDFTNGYTTVNTAVTANSTTAPDGTSTADTLTDNGTNSIHQVYRNITTDASTAYAASLFAKAGTGRYLTISWARNGGGEEGGNATFDLQSGVVTQSGANTNGGTLHSTEITDVGNGWYRCVVVASHAATGTNYTVATANAGTFTPDVVGRQSYAGAGSTFYIWGAQVELGSFATSYIPTTTASVTRASEIAKITGTNFSSWYNAAEGTIVCGFDAHAMNVNQTVFQINDDTALEAISYSQSASNAQADIRDGGSEQITTYQGDAIVEGKVAIAYKVNDSAVSKDGSAPTTDTSVTLPTVTQLLLGAVNNAYPSAGRMWIREFDYYRYRLPNDTIQELTTPI